MLAMNRRSAFNLVLSLALAAVGCCTTARASVIVTGTRVIYPSDSRDVSVQLTNNGTTPALVQTWVDAGDQSIKPEELDVPFSVSPPIFRLDQTKTQIIRLVFLGADLPSDRESIYWLNVLEIPPKYVGAPGENFVQFAIKTRLKLFYRPSRITASSETAPRSLKWSPVSSDDGGLSIKVENPSPFYVSFAEVRVQLDQGVEPAPANGMVAPFGTQVFQLKRAAGTSAPGAAGDAAGKPLRVLFKTVNDYGSAIDGAADLR